MFPAVIAFFLQRPALIGLLALAMACGVQTLRIDHVKRDLTSLRKADAAAIALSADRLKAANAVSVASQAQSVAEGSRIVTKYRTLVERIPAEIPEGADRDCVIPSGFVNLWNAAPLGPQQ